MIEKIGGQTFQDGVLVASIDAHAEIAKRGGLDEMLKESMQNNPLLARFARASEAKRK